MILKPLGRGLMVPLLAIISVAVAHSQGSSPRDASLLDAVKSGDKAAVRALVQKRVDVNVAERDGTTALLRAVQRDEVELAELLIGAGADVKAANRYGMMPLLVACTNGNAAIIDRLIRAGADPNTATPEGETALMTAARTGKVDAVKTLLAHGAKVNAQESSRGQTALMWAAAENHVEAARTLIEAGADVRARSKGGFTAMLFAVRAGRTGAVRVLLDAGADVGDTIQPAGPQPGGMPQRQGAPAGNRPAAAGGAGQGGQTNSSQPNAGQGNSNQPEALLQALNTGSRGRGAGPAGISALVLAILNAHFELASLLLDRGADPNGDAHGWTPLHQVAWTRRPPIQHGLPPPVPTGKMDSLELAQKLLARGANPNARMTREPADGARNVLNRIGSTPFLEAAKLADVPYMRLLIARGADSSITTEEGATPLMAAAGVGIWHVGENAGTNEEAFEALKLCFELGNDVSAVDANGDTALHGAVHRGSNEIVQFLVDRGAKLDVPNKIGWTPWIIADGVFYPNTYNRHLETAQLLVKLGADTKAGKRRPQDLPPSEEQATSATQQQPR